MSYEAQNTTDATDAGEALVQQIAEAMWVAMSEPDDGTAPADWLKEARAVLPLVEAQVAPLRDKVARVEALAAEMGKHKAPSWFVDMARDLRDAISGDYDLTGAICCGHDADAHDGSGCIDCACNKAPFSEGYRPSPVRVEMSEDTSRIPAADLMRADLVRAERELDAAESALRQVREDLTALADAWDQFTDADWFDHTPREHADEVRAILAGEDKGCRYCDGRGIVDSANHRCPWCQGSGRAILDSARVGAADTQPEGAGYCICWPPNDDEAGHDGDCPHYPRMMAERTPTAGSNGDTAPEACPPGWMHSDCPRPADTAPESGEGR